MATVVYLRVGVWFVVAVSLTYSVFWLRPTPPGQATPPVLAQILDHELILTQLVERLLPFVEPASIAQPLVLPEANSADLAEPPEIHQLTLADVQRRGRLTVLMHHGPASYFLYRGRQMGFEYELAKGFVRDLNVELEIRTPPAHEDLTSWLHDGKGDLIAGLVTAEGFAHGAVEVSVPYFETTAQVITRSDNNAPQTMIDLAGKTVVTPPGSVYTHTLQTEAQALALPPILSFDMGGEVTAEAVSAVVHGRAAATIVMAPLARLAHTLYPGRLRTAWTLPHPVHLVWAVRPGQQELLQAVNTYLARASRSGLKKILVEKYFHSSAQIPSFAQRAEGTLARKKRLSRYDHVIARHAEEAGFDWRLVAALIFEESRFDHTRVSDAGAYGLMQLMPFTAQMVGARSYHAPGDNIAAGVKYLQWLARRFQRGQPQDRLAFILASYVMGLGHFEDAQRIARLLGYDPDCWQESMEKVLPLLEDSQYHTKTLFGYAQGREAVRYANAILKRYELYSRYIARDLQTSEVPTRPIGQAASAAG